MINIFESIFYYTHLIKITNKNKKVKNINDNLQKNLVK